MKSWDKKGKGPGEKSMKTKVAAIIRNRDAGEEKFRTVMDEIAKMINNPKFYEALNPSTEAEVIARANKFLS